MEIREAVDRVLLGETLRSISEVYRCDLLVGLGLDPEDCEKDLMLKQAHGFVSQVCRSLGERHGDDHRALAALQDWVRRVDDYDAYDALLSNFRFDDRDRLIQRAQLLFPGPLTAHWQE